MMIETRIAKLFKNGASQAVRLPVEFRFEGDEVYITRDDATGDVVLSNRPGAKVRNEFFELLHTIDVPADFMAERPLNVLSQEQGILMMSRPRTTRQSICDAAYAGYRYGELPYQGKVTCNRSQTGGTCTVDGLYLSDD